MTSIALVVNQAARRARRMLRRRDRFWEGVLPNDLVRLTRTVDELDEAIEGFRSARIDAVAILGGDGSVHRLLEALFRHYDEDDAPMVLALAGGTMNGVPRALGSLGSPGSVLRRAVAALAEPEPPALARHVLRVREGEGEQAHLGLGFATGLVYRAFQHYYRRPQPGIVDAVNASLLPLWAALFGGPFYRGVELDVETGGTAWGPDRPHTLVAGVLDAPLLWFRPFGAPLGDSAAFHLAATSMRPRELAPRLWSIFRGRCRHPRLQIARVSEARVSVHGDVGYLIDGDLYPGGGAGTLDVALSLGPRVRFLVPAAARSRRPS